MSARAGVGRHGNPPVHSAESPRAHRPSPPFTGSLLSTHKKMGLGRVKSELMQVIALSTGFRDAEASAGARLFRGLEQRRGAGAELLEQRRLVRLGGLEMAHLDVAEAADFFRDGGKPDRDVVVVGVSFASTSSSIAS